MIPTLRAQQALGHEILLCTEGPDVGNLRAEGFQVITHGMRRSLNPVGALRAIGTIRRTLREHGTEAVILHNSLAGIVGRLGARLAGTPRVVYFAHGLACGPEQSALDWQIRFQTERLLAPLTDALIVMNDYDEDLARRTPLARRSSGVLRIRGMGVDVSRFPAESPPELRTRLAAELGVAAGSLFVLCVARLIPEKGVLDYVEAARQVVAGRPDAVFLLAGTGPLLDALRARVESAGIGRQVRILGWRGDIPDLVSACDIFTLPSYYMEGLPVSILEAMACSKPVVTTRHKGCADAVVEGDTAFLVPPRRPAELAARLLDLLGDAQLRRRMGQAGRARVESVFPLEACTADIVSRLEQAIR